jgi:uncharacterized protein YbdZ (MbtH family)
MRPLVTQGGLDPEPMRDWEVYSIWNGPARLIIGWAQAASPSLGLGCLPHPSMAQYTSWREMRPSALSALKPTSERLHKNEAGTVSQENKVAWRILRGRHGPAAPPRPLSCAQPHMVPPFNEGVTPSSQPHGGCRYGARGNGVTASQRIVTRRSVSA